MQAESSSPEVTNIEASGENLQHLTPNLEGCMNEHKTVHVWNVEKKAKFKLVVRRIKITSYEKTLWLSVSMPDNEMLSVKL